MTDRWFEYPVIDPVAIALGPVKVHWYGLMYLIGFAAAWMLGKYRARQPGSVLNENQVGDLVFWGALGVVLGGRFGYVFFYNFDKFLSDPLWLFQVWTGGMSFHGGFLGVILSCALYCKNQGLNFFKVADFAAPLVPIGLGAGRLGNFIGGELWGRAADLPWAMVFPRDPFALARHPSQLYQFALEGLVLFAILWVFSRKTRPTLSVFGLFMACYGGFRFVVEFFREPDAHIGFIAWDWLTMGQILSLPMIIIGVIFMVVAYRRAAQISQPEPVTSGSAPEAKQDSLPSKRTNSRKSNRRKKRSSR